MLGNGTSECGFVDTFWQDCFMRDAVEPITELPLATVLGPEFDAADNQAWLAAWAERWMALAPSVALGWWSDGTEEISGSLL